MIQGRKNVLNEKMLVKFNGEFENHFPVVWLDIVLMYITDYKHVIAEWVSYSNAIKIL